MLDAFITASILFVLAGCVVFRAKYHSDGNPGFFDIPNTLALRGIWSIVVILVHIPAEHGNFVQDMAGSFAYIGVTFYFLFSGYGLSLGVLRKGFARKGFWKKRLPKLLLPQFLLNILTIILFWALFGDKPRVSSFFLIAGWTVWLLVCYVVFRLAYLLCKEPKKANAFLLFAVLLISISQYTLQKVGIVTVTIWPTEIWGFLWGVLLALSFAKFRSWGQLRWMGKTAIACLGSLVLGLLYLRFKPVVFWGDYLLKIALGCAITLFLLLLNVKFSIGNKALAGLGKISYELYLSHSAVILLLSRAFPDLRSGIFIPLVLAISLFVSLGLHVVSVYLLKTIFREKA